jgi:hypothetical protein
MSASASLRRLTLASLFIAAAGQIHAARAAAQSVPPVPPRQALLNQYCVTCHNERLKTAGLALDSVDAEVVSRSPDVWEKVIRKLRAGLMPPPGRPRPEKPAVDRFVSRLEADLDRAAEANPDPGRTEPFHRLNRVEYQNAIRDVLALENDASELLPPDDASYGFDNIAGILKTSPTLLERYLSAAQRLSRLAVGRPLASPNIDTFTIRDDYPQDDRLEGLPFGTRGGARIRYNFPLDGEYLVQLRLSRRAGNGANEDVARFDDSHDLEVRVDGAPVTLFTLAEQKGQQRPNALEQPLDRKTVDANWDVRVPIKAGPHAIEVAFLKRSAVVEERLRLPFLRPIHYSDFRTQPFLGKVTVIGPYFASGPGNTPSRDRIFVCHPTTDADEPRCARSILSALARRAYRRPVGSEDLEPLLAFYEEGRAEGGFEGGIQRALELLLVSPEFLFRVERDPKHVAAGTAYRISDLELASRLSFFLWSSIPDDELIDAAVRGTLRRPGAIERQVKRMLADDRSRAFVQNFAGQWLFLRNLPTVTPDPRLFPNFDEGLRESLRKETELFFESILRENRSVLDFLTADYTFLNERLALHYGVPHIKGTHFRRVVLTDTERGGILGQGSILTVTAYPHRTSPVLRGKWVLESLFGTPPPPPPPNVPPLVETQPGAPAQSMRERMAQHRSSPACASCHTVMDPPGLSLEGFDAVGRRRLLDDSYEPIDLSGVLPDGTKYVGAAGLRQALLSRSDQFVTTLTEKLVTYALGRGVEFRDAPAIRSIVRESAVDGYKLPSLIVAVVRSTPFQMRRSARDDSH